MKLSEMMFKTLEKSDEYKEGYLATKNLDAPKDEINLYVPYVDAAGHVVGENIETITLPYSYRTYTTSGLNTSTDDLYTSIVKDEDKDGVYIAMASFITSYARNKTIRSAQLIEDNYYNGKSKARFVYADTDSLHIVLNGEDKETFIKNCGLKIDSTKLGYWDFEASFRKAKFLRQKCYLENHIISEEEYNEGINSKEKYLYSKDEKGFYFLKITVAGMPKGCYPYVDFDNFKIGASYQGKLQPKRVPGGVVLNEVDFTIKE